MAKMNIKLNNVNELKAQRKEITIQNKFGGVVVAVL